MTALADIAPGEAAPMEAAPVEAGPVEAGRGSARALLAFQRQAWSNIVFSVTRRCPLRCRHCVTSSAPDRALQLLDPGLAQAWAAELPELARRGLRHVTFTGGEPVLALQQVATLAGAAKRAGLATALVSAGPWGASERQVARVMAALGGVIDQWDFGHDLFHAEHLATEALLRAANAAAERGAVCVRVCDPGGPEAAALVRRLRQGLAAEVRLLVQPVYAVGRGGEGGLPPAPAEEGLLCLATGPFIREDGTVGPCCAALGYNARGRHPFDYGSARKDGLLAVWRRWRADRLLRFVRLAGFALPLRELEAAGLAEPGCGSRRHVCETCERLWDADGRVARLLRDWAEQPAMARLLDELETELFGATWQEQEGQGQDQEAGLAAAGRH